MHMIEEQNEFRIKEGPEATNCLLLPIKNEKIVN